MSNARLLANILSSGSLGKPANRQVFTANGTWTKPTGFGSNAVALIQVWGAGGAGAKSGGAGSCGGGGGGAFSERWVLLSALGATEAVTVGAGGVARTTLGDGAVGGTSSFGSWNTAYGGGGGSHPGSVGGSGGGGGPQSAGGIQTAGNPQIVSYTDGINFFSIGQGCNTTGSTNISGYSNHGGGGGYATATAAGASAINGGGGGGGAGTGAGGVSQHGGNGGAGGSTGTAGTAPGGGGGSGGTGNSGAGARGEVRVTVFDGT